VLVVEAASSIGGMTTTHALIPEASDHALNPCALDLAFGHFLDQIVRELNLRNYGSRSLATDPSYGTIGAEGESICVRRDPQRTAEEIRRYGRGGVPRSGEVCATPASTSSCRS
jgi:phytoene dehydrogenase-like protein